MGPLSDLKAILTEENRNRVRRYIYNCNEGVFAALLLSAFDQYKEKPLSDAFYLHELVELEAFKEQGHEFVEVEATPKFREHRTRIYLTERGPHLQAAMAHCEYLHLIAQQRGYDLSLGTVVERDPFTSQEDKRDLFARHSGLGSILSEGTAADEFFVSLAMDESGIFCQPFSLGNCERYREAILRAGS